MSANIPKQQRECPADILLLIFEEVRRTVPACLPNLRLASRTFNVLINPIFYRHLRLNDAVVECFKIEDEPNVSPEIVVARRRFRSAICTLTRQITINKALSWGSVTNLLLSLDNFHHLNLSLWEHGRFAYNNGLPQSVLNALAERWPTAKFSVDNLSWEFDSIDGPSSCPPARIVSLEFRDIFRRRPIQTERTLKDILLKCDQLKILHLLHVRSGSRFKDEEIEQSERLPAVEELFLQGYFWLHSPRIATSFWDWSKLTSLRLEKVFIVKFLESVPPVNLLKLRHLVTDGHCESAVDHTKVRFLPVIYT